MMNIEEIREALLDKWLNGDFTIDKTGVRTLELIGTSFVADGPAIFGTPNQNYINRELDWYESQSLSVRDFPGGPPEIWNQVSDLNGAINSNYGWCIYSKANGSQFSRVMDELEDNRDSRRGVMIYTRPSMHEDYDDNGRSDFMCTNAVNYFIRDDKLYSVVQMRSNDVVFGYRNDYAWQAHVLENLAWNLDIETGGIHWNAASLHVYERHFFMVDHYSKTGETSITKKRYRELYPDSELCQ